MGLIIFETTSKIVRNTKSVLSNFLWYEWAPKDKNGNPIKDENGNDVLGSMKNLRGGRRDFKYNAVAKKIEATTATVRVADYKNENNKKEIEQWIEENRFELQLERNDTSTLSATFPDHNKNVVKKSLEYTNFIYEINA